MRLAQAAQPCRSKGPNRTKAHASSMPTMNSSRIGFPMSPKNFRRDHAGSRGGKKDLVRDQGDGPPEQPLKGEDAQDDGDGGQGHPPAMREEQGCREERIEIQLVGKRPGLGHNGETEFRRVHVRDRQKAQRPPEDPERGPGGNVKEVGQRDELRQGHHAEEPAQGEVHGVCVLPGLGRVDDDESGDDEEDVDSRIAAGKGERLNAGVTQRGLQVMRVMVEHHQEGRDAPEDLERIEDRRRLAPRASADDGRRSGAFWRRGGHGGESAPA